MPTNTWWNFNLLLRCKNNTTVCFGARFQCRFGHNFSKMQTRLCVRFDDEKIIYFNRKLIEDIVNTQQQWLQNKAADLRCKKIIFVKYRQMGNDWFCTKSCDSTSWRRARLQIDSKRVDAYLRMWSYNSTKRKMRDNERSNHFENVHGNNVVQLCRSPSQSHPNTPKIEIWNAMN